MHNKIESGWYDRDGLFVTVDNINIWGDFLHHNGRLTEITETKTHFKTTDN